LWFLITVQAVRRSWLCGKAPVTGQDFAHRRGWIRERIKQLCSMFAIDAASYAIPPARDGVCNPVPNV